MQYVNDIIKLGALISAIIVIWKVVKTLVNLSNILGELKRHSTENYLAILRLTIMSPNMPIGERISSGIKYLEQGGNGDVKKYLKEEFDIDDTTETASHYVKEKKN